MIERGTFTTSERVLGPGSPLGFIPLRYDRGGREGIRRTTRYSLFLVTLFSLAKVGTQGQALEELPDLLFSNSILPKPMSYATSFRPDLVRTTPTTVGRVPC